MGADSVDDPRVAIGLSDGNVWSESALASYVQIMATRPYQPTPSLPPILAGLDYDSYRMIAFRPAETLYRDRGRPLQMELYHRGYIYPERVQIHLVEPSGDRGQTASVVRRLPFDAKYFDYRGRAAGLPHDADFGTAAGYAGFNVIGHLPSSEWMREVWSFIGSSYFRGLSDNQSYGTSCRGLAVDIGLAKEEEFPAFRAFWIEAPTEGSKELVVHALLDSPSVIGAYRFVINPGEVTSAVVDAQLHFRDRPDGSLPEKVGLAPMSSMWMWGQGHAGPKTDARPEVHDTDGLLVHADDAWIWRPITRQPHPSTQRTNASRLQGFGLMQRQRDPAAYSDPEAIYERRPSTWIEPLAGWTPGGVELLEFPTEFEGMDNIAAWYHPVGLFPSGKTDPLRPIRYRYRVSFLGSDPAEHRLAKAIRFAIDYDATDDAIPDGMTPRPQPAAELPAGQATEENRRDAGKTSVAANAIPPRPELPADGPQKPVEVSILFAGSALDGLPLAAMTPQVDGIRARILDPQLTPIKTGMRPDSDPRSGQQSPTTDQTSRSRGDANDRPGGNDRSTANATTVRLSFFVLPETPYNYELRATLLTSEQASGTAGSSSSDTKTNTQDAAADAGFSRPLTETWSYLCPPQP